MVGDCLPVRGFNNLVNIVRIKETQIFTSKKGVTGMERERTKMNPVALG